MPSRKDRFPKRDSEDEDLDDDQLGLLTEAELERRGWKRAPPSLDRPFFFAGLGAALVGAVVLAGLVLVHARDVVRQKALVPATGVVVEQRNESYGTRSRVVLTIRFTTAAGRRVDFQRTYDSTATTRPAKGDAVTVLYDPADPTRSEIQDGNWVGYALVGAVGTGFLLTGLALVTRTLAARRRGRRQETGHSLMKR